MSLAAAGGGVCVCVNGQVVACQAHRAGICQWCRVHLEPDRGIVCVTVCTWNPCTAARVASVCCKACGNLPGFKTVLKPIVWPVYGSQGLSSFLQLLGSHLQCLCVCTDRHMCRSGATCCEPAGALVVQLVAAHPLPQAARALLLKSAATEFSTMAFG